MKKQLDLIRGLIYKCDFVLEKDKTLIKKNKNELSQSDFDFLKINKGDRKKQALVKLKEVEKMVRPKFFEYVGDKSYAFRNFDTSMDYLQEEVDRIKKENRGKGVEYIEIMDLLVKQNPDKANKHQIRKIVDIIKETDKNINQVYNNKDMDNISQNEYIKILNKKESYKKYAIEQIAKRKITVVTVYNILNRIFNKSNRDKEIKKYKLLLLGILYSAHRKKFEQVFKCSQRNIEILEKSEDGNINIWGENYRKIKSNYKRVG
ncbi:MAG: hypothetical protein ACOCRK_07485 [bacterium]